MAVALRPQHDAPASQAPLLASGGCEEVIKLWRWNLETATCVQTLRADGPYEGMEIAGATGLNHTQQVALRALGAVGALDFRAA